MTDIRNPLLHIPPSVYDLVTGKMQKPMIVVLNKIDLVPTAVVEMWKLYLQKRFPLCHFVCFSSRSVAVHGSTDISSRRRVLSKKLEVGDPAAIHGAIDILCACGIDANEAQRVAEELNASLETDNGLNELSLTEKAIPKRKSRRKQKAEKLTTIHPGSSNGNRTCQHCGVAEAAFACLSCAGSALPLSMITSETEAMKHGHLFCKRCDREEHADLTSHEKYPLKSTRLSAKEKAQGNAQMAAIFTIGLIGHPNVGKSSVLNALAGKKLVSVSHTPGHTKRLQSIMITSDICICDCPGLVFPFAKVPKYLQELCGLYPYSQIREPYSSVRFLAEHIDLQQVLDLKPRTQWFDGMEEELVGGATFERCSW